MCYTNNDRVSRIKEPVNKSFLSFFVTLSVTDFQAFLKMMKRLLPINQCFLNGFSAYYKRKSCGGEFVPTVNVNMEALYASSSMAAMTVRRGGEITYSNSACDKLFGGDYPDMTDIHTGSSYERILSDKGRTFRLYITAVSEDESLVNVTPCEYIAGSCFPVLCAAVRNAVNVVSAAADEIASDCSEGTAVLLNTIDGTMLSLLSEFLIPEEIQLLGGLTAEDFEAVSISECMKKFVSELSEIFAAFPVVINSDISAGLFARVDTRALRLILTDFAAEVMNGEYQTEAISVRLFRIPDNKIRIVLSCGYLKRLPGTMNAREIRKPEGYAPQKILSELMKDIFGCSIDYRAAADYSSIQIEMTASETPFNGNVGNRVRYYGLSDRFSDENAYMARFGLNHRYKKTDL